jgi:hypothetical protein
MEFAPRYIVDYYEKLKSVKDRTLILMAEEMVRHSEQVLQL